MSSPASELPDFIEVFEGLLDAAQCQAIIRRFDACPDLKPGQVGSGYDPNLKDSDDITISGRPEWADVDKLLNTAMMRALCAYIRRYPQIVIAPLALGIRDAQSGEQRLLRADDIESMDHDTLVNVARCAFRPGAINIQRYRADRGGYPYWHCEHYPFDAQAEALHRVVLWTVYLNDGFAGGETEFLFQRRLVQPRTGSFLIAPAAYTHTHRGNMPRGSDKYIATSWVLFRRAEELFGAR